MNVMDSLLKGAADVSHEVSNMLSSTVMRSSAIITGKIEHITTSAMRSLSDPIFSTNRKLTSSPVCLEMTSWNMNELMDYIGAQLTTCTKDLNQVLNDFQDESSNIITKIENYITQFENLPVRCKLNLVDGNTGDHAFAGSTSCFVSLMAEFNFYVSNELNRASKTLIRSRQMTQNGEIKAQKCADEVVASFKEFLDAQMALC